MSGPGERLLARELLLASAGSGKTYQLSSRLIGLLAVETPPEEILASTFTRKAAGEILDRVLVRLARAALDEGEARDLAASVPADVPRELLTPRGCGRILTRILGDLHRLQVHTLDAFFHRVVRAFSLELGLPGEWALADEPTGERLRSRALEEALLQGDEGVLVELVRAVGRGDADRSVHGLLMEHVSALHDLYRERVAGSRGPGQDDDFWGGSPGPEPVPDDQVQALIQGIREMDLPRTASGDPNSNWLSNHEAVMAALDEGDWEGLLDVSLVKRVLSGGDQFARADIPPEFREAVLALAGAARAHLHRELRARVRALGRFLPRYHRHLTRLQASRGLFGFKDLTYALAGLGRAGSLDEVHYRLDGRIRHVLLDEFQDTSIAQWAVLEPLVGEILSGYEGERAAFVVADPKQSIYGWRDGEPRILKRIEEDFGIEPSTMALSWRSSGEVLELVNRVFEDVARSPVVTADDRVAEIAGRWADAFQEHGTARTDQPGYASVETAPDPAPDGDRVEALLARAADRVVEIHGLLPGARIGILTRRNKTVARLMALLRDRGIEASEEGGVPVADSAPVVALLALLRIADHPGDTIARYLAARTPAGALVGLERWDSDREAREVSRRVRQMLLAQGYGPVLSRWVRALDPQVGARDRDRLRKLLELAFRWDEGASLRPMDFVRAVEASRAEGVGESPVRIMTVHRAKGLEFDVVVLPELDGTSYSPGSVPAFVPERGAEGAGAVERVLPGVRSHQEPLFPELERAAAQHREGAIRDSLSALYVALTRARFAVHLIMKPDPKGKSSAKSDARLVRTALTGDVEGRSPGKEAADLERSWAEELAEGKAPPDTVLWSVGSPDWWQDPGAPERLHRPPARRASVPPSGDGPLLAPAPRRRLLRRRTPSELEGGDEVSPAQLLRPLPRRALERGSLIHAWLEEVAWLDEEGEGLPDTDRLMEIAAREAPGLQEPGDLLQELREQLQAPGIRALLTRASYPDGAVVEREIPFLARDRDGILQGVADRVVRIPDPEGERLQVTDWKTDRIPAEDAGALEERAAHYRPQIEAYCRALARLEGVDGERVEGVLAFLAAGRVVRVPAG